MQMNGRHSIVVMVVISLLLGCSKKLEKLYYDPDQLTTARIEKLFTELLNNYRTRPSYWEIRTFAVMHAGIYSQTVGYLNTTGVYQQNLSYVESKWNDFYRPAGNGSGCMALFREMQKLYRELPAAAQQNSEVYLKAAAVVLYDQACQMVDLWGDIPFSEAGSLNLNGQARMARYDDGKEIYKEAIDKLKELNDYFATAELGPTVVSLLKTQDILLQGELSRWQRYSNALRFRLLMRISTVDEVYSREGVAEMLDDPARFPLLSDQAQYEPAREDILLQPLANYTLTLRDALTELTNFSAPYHMLEKVLLPVDDPRIPVFYDKYGTYIGSEFTPNTQYKAMPTDWPLEQQQVNLGKFAILDSATFLNNSFIPGIIIGSAEISFLKAEAFLRWGGGDAAQAYKRGIQQSIHFYYYLNHLNARFKSPEPYPSQARIENFLAEPALQLTGGYAQQMEKIACQRWVNFNFLQSAQAWAEIRRTGYPVLEFRENSQPDASLPPKRLLYPGNEVTYNVNYGAVRDKDKTYFPVFWQNN